MKEYANSVCWYAQDNAKYMEDYDKNKQWSYIQYWNVNNLYWWAISENFPGNNVEWIEDISQFNDDFINYNEESDEGYFLEADVQYLEKLYEFLNDLPFLIERMKIEKVEMLVATLHDKTEYIIRLRNLK